jgi:RNA polymerase sigma-70 factor (ECF subfamily)
VSEELDQRDIVCGLRQGDRDAFEALCQQYSSRVWRYVARLIGSNADAVADVYQETLLAVAKGGRTIHEDTRLWAWLSGIAHNQAALYWRKQYRAPVEAGEIDQLASTQAADPAAVLAQAELVEAVRRLLADMQAEQVALLSAKYLDEQSIAEMVTALGGTTEGIRSRLARARREFRTRYERIRTDHSAVEPHDLDNASPRKGD